MKPLASSSLSARMTALRPASDSAISVRIDGKQEKFSSVLLASRSRMNFVVDDPTAEAVAQSRAFQLTLPARSITLRGSPSRPLCDVLFYGVPFVAR